MKQSILLLGLGTDLQSLLRIFSENATSRNHFWNLNNCFPRKLILAKMKSVSDLKLIQFWLAHIKMVSKYILALFLSEHTSYHPITQADFT